MKLILLLSFLICICSCATPINTGALFTCLKVRFDPLQTPPEKSYLGQTSVYHLNIDTRAEGTLDGSNGCDDPCCSVGTCSTNGKYSPCVGSGTNSSFLYVEFDSYAAFVFMGDGETCVSLTATLIKCPLPQLPVKTSSPVTFDVLINFFDMPANRLAPVTFYTGTEDTYQGLASCNSGTQDFSECQNSLTFVTKILDSAVEKCTAEPDLPGNWTLGGTLFQCFVFNDAIINNTDIQGRLLVGHDLYLNEGSIGMEIFQYKYLPCDKLPIGSPRFAVVVGNRATTKGGSIHNGDLAYGDPQGDQYVSDSTGFNPGCVAYQAATNPIPVDFDGWETYLKAETAAFCALNDTGSATITGGTDPMLIIVGSNQSGIVEIVTIDGAALATVKTVQVLLISSDISALIINVRGTFAAFYMAGMQPLSLLNSKILWNFCEATVLNINCVDVAGSILAPYADALKTTGVIFGKLIVNNLSGYLQQDLPCRGFISPPSNNSICPIFTGDCSFNSFSPTEICMLNDGSAIGGTTDCVSITDANSFVTLSQAICGPCPNTANQTGLIDPTGSNGQKTETDHNAETSSEVLARNSRYAVFGVSVGLITIISIVVAIVVARKFLQHKRANRKNNYVPLKDSRHKETQQN